MRLYHFLKEEHAIDDLKNRHLKIAQFEDLNDPFEMLAIRLPNPIDRLAFTNMKKEMSKDNGLICFSKEWSNPVIWSHYADRHKGICLGFDISENLPDDALIPIEYEAERLAVEILDAEGNLKIDETLIKKISATKYDSWKYEQEVRILVNLNEKDIESGFFFFDFEGSLMLREVILGAERNKDVSKIQTILKSYENVRLIQSRMAFRSFRIVERIDITQELNGEAS